MIVLSYIANRLIFGASSFLISIDHNIMTVTPVLSASFDKKSYNEENPAKMYWAYCIAEKSSFAYDCLN